MTTSSKMAVPPPESIASGNTEEDWHIYEVLCKDLNVSSFICRSHILIELFPEIYALVRKLVVRKQVTEFILQS